MELGGWTATSLAHRLGRAENPQTVHYLAQGDRVRRCRATRRAALARVLNVPEEWLAGGDYGLPLPGVMPLLKEVEGSPRVLLAAGPLFHRCYNAVQRDLEREPVRASLASGWNATNDVHWFMLSTLGSLLSPSRLHAVLVRPLAHGPTPTVAELEAQPLQVPDYTKWFEPLQASMWAPRPTAEALDVDTERATLGLIAGWAQILRPWFDGETMFDYKRFWELAGGLNPAVRVSIPQSYHSRPAVEVLPPAVPTSPYWLVDWPLLQAAPSP